MSPKPEKIAVIGTGIAGMACGHFLKDGFDVTLYEKEKIPGGHTNTICVDEDGKPVFIDTGFMVYNEITYPHLTRLFKELDIPTQATQMSFSVQDRSSNLEYSGTGWNGLFAQRQNILRPEFWALLVSIDRFNRECLEVLENSAFNGVTIKEYTDQKKLGAAFLSQYLIPMSSAVWSTDPERMLDFPIRTLVRFFKNHGLLGGLKGHFEWRTVKGGSRIYRDRMLEPFKKNGTLRLAQAAKCAGWQDGRVFVEDIHGNRQAFDRVIFACHADQALRVLDQPTAEQSDLLGAFRYQKNRAALHTDESVMPSALRAWSSWNFRWEAAGSASKASTTYWMNSLQKVSNNKNYFVSINDGGAVDAKKILWQAEYEHPLFDAAAVKAQEKLTALNQSGRIYFCGSYFKYGFHEDALDSALEVCRLVKGAPVWR